MKYIKPLYEQIALNTEDIMSSSVSYSEVSAEITPTDDSSAKALASAKDILGIK